MTIANQDFEMISGDTKFLNVLITDSTYNSPLNLLGSTIIWKLKINSATTLTKSSSTGGVEITPFEGRCKIFVDANDTKDIYGLFKHEVVLVDGSGHVSTVLTGRITILKA